MGNLLLWDQSNKNYILTHGVSEVDWRFYKHSLPENVYDVYVLYWREKRKRSNRANAMPIKLSCLVAQRQVGESVWVGQGKNDLIKRWKN
jgi:hypothetical protein